MNVCLKLKVILFACGLGSVNKTTKLKTKTEGHKAMTMCLKTQGQDQDRKIWS